MRVNGLFDWVRHNDARSLLFLVAFALLSQPMAMVALFMPLLFVDPGHAPWYNWTGYGLRYAPLVAVAAAGYFALVMARDFSVLRRDVALRFVDHSEEPRLCGLVEPLAIALGVGSPYVAVIDSGSMNALACGISSRFQVLAFTRGLVDGLDDDELSAVIAHELIHLRNGDARLIAAANAFMRNLELFDRVNFFKPKRYRQIAVVLSAPVVFPLYLGVALLSQLGARLGWASRLLISSAREYIADAEAVRLTQNPAALISALRRIEGRSALAGLPPEHDALLIDGAAAGRFATHPTIAQRIEALVALTGSLALEDRPRRDTRPEYLRAPAASEGPWSRASASNELDRMRQLARKAVLAEPPRAGALAAVLRVGADGSLGLFGLRWDLAAALAATFCVSVLLNGGDMLGLLRQMGHVLDRPDASTQWFLDKARACRAQQWSQITGGESQGDACDPNAEFVGRAKAIGVTVLGDGRIIPDRLMSMLSPTEIERAQRQDRMSAFRSLTPREPRQATDVKASYPLPLHEAWLRLKDGDIGDYLQSQRCGLIIRAEVEAQSDQSVTWRITSEGEERVRFVATLTAFGEAQTRVKLDIADLQPALKLYDGANPSAPPGRYVKRPALDYPLRPRFAEAIEAMLEDRPFDIHKVEFGSGPSETLSPCSNQRFDFEGGARFSIHDPDKSE